MDREVLLQWRSELVESWGRVERLLFHLEAILADLADAGDCSGGQDEVRRYRKSKNVLVSNAAYAILRGRDRAMHRRELFEVVSVLGFRFGGQVPLNTFSCLLVYDRRFVRGSARGVWELAEWDLDENLTSRDFPSCVGMLPARTVIRDPLPLWAESDHLSCGPL